MTQFTGTTPAARKDSPWKITIGAMIGMTVSGGPIMFAAANMFIRPITQDLGWTRTEYFAAASVATIFSGIVGVFVGGVADRFGVRRVLLAGLFLFALGQAMMSTLTGSMVQYFAITMFIGAMTTAQGPLLYSKAVSQAADRRRGLALAIAMSGSAIGMAAMPHLASAYIGSFGWRGAELAIAATIVVVAFPAVWFLIRPPAALHGQKGAERPVLAGLDLKQVLRTRAFWLLAFIILISNMAVNGSVAHLGAMVPDKGLPLPWAATCLSAVAAGSFLARIVAGVLLDRYHTPQIGQIWFLLPLAGALALSAASTPAAFVVASFLLGLGQGAELELLAYYIGRFFGLRSFGVVYGIIFGAYLLGVSLGGLMLARFYDHFGDYQAGLMVAAGLLGAAAVALLFIGRYVYVAREAAPA